MTHWHPTNVELAGLSDQGSTDRVARHVRSCARCRRVVSEFGWLDSRLGDTLVDVAEGLPVPRSAWCVVSDRLEAARHRLLVRRQLSAVASAALVVCVLLSVPGFIRPATVAPGLQPSIALRPTPTVDAVPLGGEGGVAPSGTSSVVTAPRQATGPMEGPALVPQPTPPESMP